MCFHVLMYHINEIYRIDFMPVCNLADHKGITRRETQLMFMCSDEIFSKYLRVKCVLFLEIIRTAKIN